MNLNSETLLEEQLGPVSDEIEALKSRVETSSSHFELLMARIDALPCARLSSNGLDNLAPRTENFVTWKFPEPSMLRRIIRLRQKRKNLFPGIEFADPAWDMLLDLAAAKTERRRVSVSSLCLASGVPSTTALRWIGQMIEANFLARQEDLSDRRRVYLSLTEFAENSLLRYFEEAEEQIDTFA